ncbi:envelope stress sensor histidine kinase CpxA [Marinomonas sp. C2222]|uniref:histidine kinase n=1 Tax=Marinomonas sargassi TaxID=2984494 RepID=A0ABT2YTG9_9GAMM|nr:envelope stress sensor histidine kinase CpxA [Marinomonas sargassi]MCV2403201.1 envelope stress sensor histidine kinase CpxA [Marinomonas sargassi]
MKLPNIGSLYGRIFAIFWFTMFLVTMAVLALPKLDPRLTKDLPQRSYSENILLRDLLQQESMQGKSLKQAINAVEKQSKRDKEDKAKLFITDAEGTLLAWSNRAGFSMRILRNFITLIENPEQPQQKLYGRTLLSGPFPIQLTNQTGFLYIGVKSDAPPFFLLHLLDNPWRFLLAVMLVSTPFLLWLSWALTQPARRLEAAAKRVAQGNFETDEKLEKGPSEFQQAGASFNHMVEAVNSMISRQQRLLSDISHELRSPLTRLKMAQGLAVRKQGESTELSRIETESERLETMISELLELSRMQVDSHLNREEQPLSSLWEALLVDSQFEAEQNGKALSFSAIPERTVLCYPQLLMSALENIVRNAICYGHSQIRINMQITGDKLTIRVEDDGQGVPETELESIFRPFYRVSTARDRRSGGTGLGLAITESAVRQHNGSIQASCSELGGLLVEVSLPLVKA